MELGIHMILSEKALKLKPHADLGGFHKKTGPERGILSSDRVLETAFLSISIKNQYLILTL